MNNNKFRLYIIFWLSQSISQLGSAMTSYALIIWAFGKEQSTLTVSLMAFCSYLPYVLVSLVAGGYIDSHSKKRIMVVSDSIAALSSLTILILWNSQALEMVHIYILNTIIGFMNAFQSPAQSVAIGMMVPAEKMSKASGMSSFSGNLVAVVSPVLGSALYGIGGLTVVICIDLISFLIAVTVLIVWIRIPESKEQLEQHSSALKGCKEGFAFLRENKGLYYIVVTMAVLNFFSRLTYENILSPMLLARSNQNTAVLATVNAVLGIGGILGGLFVSLKNNRFNRVRMIYVSAAISFLGGDLLMGLGKNVVVWSVAGLAASVPIPFIMAAQQVILYEYIPKRLQGRVFAARNAIQFGTIPIGILLGGWLSDYVFEPMMKSNTGFPALLHKLVGTGKGSGMAVMFLCTGICGSLLSLWFYHKKEIQKFSYEKN